MDVFLFWTALTLAWLAGLHGEAAPVGATVGLDRTVARSAADDPARDGIARTVAEPAGPLRRVAQSDASPSSEGPADGPVTPAPPSGTDPEPETRPAMADVPLSSPRMSSPEMPPPPSEEPRAAPSSREAETDSVGGTWFLTDLPTLALLAGVFCLLALAAGIGAVLRRQSETTISPAIVDAFNHRVVAWWTMFATLIVSVLIGRGATVILFFCISFWALREFITMTPTRLADHRALFWTFFIITPAQYLFIFLGHDTLRWLGWGNVDFYGVYTIFIPVYCSLFISARIAFAGDPKRFLERSAKIQAGLLITVYALSHAPAMLDLELLQWQSSTGTFVPWNGSRTGLLFYFIIVVQLADVYQWIASRMFTWHVIAPEINAGRTWEGFFIGLLVTTLTGTLLWWVTPFTMAGSGVMAAVIAVAAFAGTMTMSAIKRDRGVRDYGTLVRGHVGVLDRIDSVCFAAPVFYHLTRLFLSPEAGWVQVTP